MYVILCFPFIIWNNFMLLLIILVYKLFSIKTLFHNEILHMQYQ